MRDDGVWAITRSGRIYVGRGRWNGQKPSQKGTFLTDLVVGVGELAVGDISQLADPEVLA